MQLVQLIPGLVVRNLVPQGEVTLLQVQPLGERVCEVVFRTPDGGVDARLVYADEAAHLEPVHPAPRFAFDADARRFRLASEALRIRWAFLFDPHLAVHTSLLEPLPHQITAVYGEMLPRQPLRYLLADDPGAGKTVMTGLLIKELWLRGDVQRCLIVCPGALAEQWQDELSERFGLAFDILTNDRIAAARTGNIFVEVPWLIARLDKLSRDEALQAQLGATDWDLIVVDEAHKLSATYFGGEVKETKRYKLGKLLSTITRHFLLLTATPHDGKEEDFQLFLALLDGDRFEGRFRDGVHTVDVSDLMRRLVKEQLYRMDGTPLFPERRATTVEYALSEPEVALYKAVTDYVREEFNRADALDNERRRGTVGFALTILQRRLASSPEAIYQSLVRRRERLEQRLRAERLRLAGAQAQAELGWTTQTLLSPEDLEDLEEAPGAEQEAAVEELVDEATAARTLGELEAEIASLRRLERLADQVRRSGQDRKWQELARILQDEALLRDAHGARRKLIIFTEHRDTLRYLVERIQTLLGRPEAVVAIHGGTSREERRALQERFTQDKTVVVLVATDAAGEGINLQRAHLMVNYDMPWNPNRIEQRFGRIHRIGQTEVCHLWNLVAKDTREGEVYLTLLRKLESAQQALGGAVFDVLGKALDGADLRRLLIEAVRYGDQPAVRARLTATVADRVDLARLSRLVQERALTPALWDRAAVEAVRAAMERALAQRLQPHYVAAFFQAMFTELGGAMHPREAGRWEITYVPRSIRSRDRQIGRGNPVLPRYERVTFDPALVRPPGLAPAELLAPGHPLLDAVLDLALERDRPLLARGTVLIDPQDAGTTPRVLVYLEHEIQAATASGPPRTISRRLQFVEVDAHGHAVSAGPAPYLDYRPPTGEEQAGLAAVVEEWRTQHDVEALARQYALEHLVPEHLAEVRQRHEAWVTKTLQAVRERLTQAIAYWDHRARELAEEEARGKPNARLNAQMARARADELEVRLRTRTAELERARQVHARSPLVLGAALVIPAGLVRSLVRGTDLADPGMYARHPEAVEAAAMEAVVAVERALGHVPRDVSLARLGYDIESAVAEGALRFIEVKGRRQGADTVTVTANEIRTALNRPDQYVLALVSIPDDASMAPDIRYVWRPFGSAPDFGVTHVTYDWEALWAQGTVPH